MKMNKILLTIIGCLLTCNLIAAQNVIEGIVLDKQTNKPIPAATIRIEGSNKGTICAKDGTFRLPKGYFFNKSNVKITSIGYYAKVVSLDLREDKVTIYLEQNPIELNAAIVVGEIEVNEIIKRAINKKEENRRKYNTLQGLLYSKFVLDMSSFVDDNLMEDKDKTFKTKVTVKSLNEDSFYVSREKYGRDSLEITVHTNTEFEVNVNGKKVSVDTLITSKHKRDKKKTFKTKVTVKPIVADSFYVSSKEYGRDSLEITVHTNTEFEIKVNDEKVSVDTLIVSKHNSVYIGEFLEGFIYETFSEKYIDKERKIDKTLIVNRKQTANVPKTLNTMVLEQFVDFSQDEIDFVDAKIIAPLHKNALTHYKFKLLERKLFEDKYIYVIDVIPNTKVYPTFQGTISILEGTYQLIEAKLKPSANTKIHLIDSIEWYEKFENIGNDIWFPTYMENNATIKIKLLPFVPAIEVAWNTTSIYSDVIIDQPIPDFIYNDSIIYVDGDTTRKYKSNKMYDADSNVIQNIYVHPDADSTKAEYWEDNSIISLTEKEKEIYASVDTAAKKTGLDTIYNIFNSMNIDSIMAESYSVSKNNFSFNWFPDFKYNRVEDYSLGVRSDINIPIPYTKLSGVGLYSLGQYRWFGNAKLEVGNNIKNGGLFSYSNILPIMSKKTSFSISAEIFSNVRHFSSPFVNINSYMGYLDMWIAGRDYCDYYRTDGWNTQLNFNYKKLKLNATYENRRDFVLDKSTYIGYWSKKDFSKFRDNPIAETGDFHLIKFSSTFGNNITSTAENFQYKFNANYQYGIRSSDKSNFSQIYGTASIMFPIFETGYGNILMLLSVGGGWTDNNTPVQQLFAIEQTSFISNLFASSDNTFITAYENYLGGTEFYSYHARLNLRDWWWRLLRLPKIKGRGLELSFAGTIGKFFNNGTTKLSNLYHSTKNGYYTEAGFRIGRIPIPGTDLIYWSLETRFGIGEYAKSRHGFLLNFQLPF